MNTEELKKLLKGSTSVLIMENGEPSFVIVNYENYKKLLSNEQEKEVEINRPALEIDHGFASKRPVANGTIQHGGDVGIGTFQHKVGEKEAELLDKINKEILALKSEIDKEEKYSEIALVD